MRTLLLISLAVCCGCGGRPYVVRRPPALTDGGPRHEYVEPPIRIADARPPAPVVDGPPPPVITPKAAYRDPAAILLQTNGELRDAFFEYDRTELRPDGFPALQQDAALLIPILRDFPTFVVTVEGHCDERGSAEYNLALGDHRAARVAEILRSLGVPAAQIRTVSFGKEMPQCTEPAESCWQRNRRAHLRLAEQ